jgi:hypothetical protein
VEGLDSYLLVDKAVVTTVTVIYIDIFSIKSLIGVF